MRRLQRLLIRVLTLIRIIRIMVLLTTQDGMDAAYTNILVSVDHMTMLISMQMKCAVYAVVVVLAAPAALELQYSDLQ